jgi:hypothetical protein
VREITLSKEATMFDKTMSRRAMLKGLGLFTGAAALGMGLPLPLHAQQAGETPAAQTTKRPWWELGLLDDPVMDNRVLWYLSATWQGMADIGEVLETAGRIAPGDNDSWYREWLKTAERLQKAGDAILASGHRISAGEAYLRAANYYRAALMGLPEPLDPGMRQSTQRSVQCHDKAIELLSLPARAVQIPYEGTTLPGYFWRSPIAGPKAPLLIVHEGRDAWGEETKYLADAAGKRGYHCLQFNGPGQGSVLRTQGLPFRADWDKVITPVVDFALSLPGVDAERLALLGISFGGFLVPRAVAFEKRIKIGITNPAYYDWYAVVTNYFAEASPDLLKALEAGPKAFNGAIAEISKIAPPMAWGVKDEMWKQGATSPYDLMEKLKAYTNADIVDKIMCRMLVMDGEAEAFGAGQAKRFYDALNCPKEYMLFTAEDTGLVHCQAGALAVGSQRMFDWLEENI